MATVFANMPTAIPTREPHSLAGSPSVYGQQNISPPLSLGSSASPIQAHHQFANRQHPRQLREPKQTTFIPAVLRPTERPCRPVRSSPPTPPQSLNSPNDSPKNSLQSSQTSQLSSTTTQSPTTISRAPTRGSGDLNLGAKLQPLKVHTRTTSLFDHPVAQKAASLLSPSTPSSSQPTFPQPTRAHWKPDVLASECDLVSCSTNFSLFQRRHHCRYCGGVFCNRHADKLVPLDEGANFDMTGGWWRACEQCHALWEKEVEDEARGIKKVPSAETQSIQSKGDVTPEQDNQVAQSVPRDWTWSTF